MDHHEDYFSYRSAPNGSEMLTEVRSKHSGKIEVGHIIIF